MGAHNPTFIPPGQGGEIPGRNQPRTPGDGGGGGDQPVTIGANRSRDLHEKKVKLAGSGGAGFTTASLKKIVAATYEVPVEQVK